jgi:integrase
MSVSWWRVGGGFFCALYSKGWKVGGFLRGRGERGTGTGILGHREKRRYLRFKGYPGTGTGIPDAGSSKGKINTLPRGPALKLSLAELHLNKVCNMNPLAISNDCTPALPRAVRIASEVPRKCKPLRSSQRKRKYKGGDVMGRYPFLTRVKEYLKAMQPYYSQTTFRQKGVILRAIGSEIERLREKKIIRTSRPKQITELEITALLKTMKDKGLDLSTQAVYLDILNGFLRWCGNSVIDRMRTMKMYPLPTKCTRKRIRVLTEEELQRIFAVCDALPGWQGEVARFIYPFYAYTGVRHSELRLAHLEDIDTHTWTFTVKNPKGKTRGAPERLVPIPPPLRQIVRDYLYAREKRIQEWGLTHAIPLIPAPPAKKTNLQPDFYTRDAFITLTYQIADLSGVKFTIKDFRSTFAQISKNRGVSIEAVSRVLGHASTSTTEAFYARIAYEDALREVANAWELPILGYTPKNRGNLSKLKSA